MASTQPWVEKYRPKNIGEVVYQHEVIKTLKCALETNNLPHLLFYGPPGTGKTSTALAIARQLYGPELMKARVLELNASDERGINVVRQKIKAFASGSVGAPVPGYPCPPYKLLILDEADSMTQDAQNALRRTMELTSRVTRFCFVCNYVSRIIEPLASRCAKFRFRPLHLGIMSDRIHFICAQEGVKLDTGALETLAQISGGDLRRAITTLQSAVRRAAGDTERRVTPQVILDVSGQVPAPIIEAFWAKCKPVGSGPGSKSGSSSFDEIQDAVQELMYEGYAAQQVFAQLQDAVLRDGSVPDLPRARVLDLLAAADYALSSGADETLQLLNVAGQAQAALRAAAR